MKKLVLLGMIVTGMLFLGCIPGADEWITLFDGETLNGWTPSEDPGSWKIEEGAIVTAGKRSHLFYTGDVRDHNFKNFEFSADVKTTSRSNSGIYIHTRFQEEGWPEAGYECAQYHGRIRERGTQADRKHLCHPQRLETGDSRQ
jgi:hypothetical protein